jgi:fumarate reductase subunit D
MPDTQQLFDVEEKNIYAALCYVGVLVFVPLILKKDDPYVNWHIRQGLVVLGVIILSLIASAWLEAVGNILFLVIMIVNIIALVQALLGKTWKIPFIGDVVDKFKI